MRDLNEELQLAKDGVRAAKARENSLKEELENLNMDFQRSQKSHNKLHSEKEALEDQLNEQKKKVQRLSSGLQVRPHVFPIQKGSLPLFTCTINVCGYKIPVSLILSNPTSSSKHLDSESSALFSLQMKSFCSMSG